MEETESNKSLDVVQTAQKRKKQQKKLNMKI